MFINETQSEQRETDIFKFDNQFIWQVLYALQRQRAQFINFELYVNLRRV